MKYLVHTEFDIDDRCFEAMRLIMEENHVSMSFIQRKLGIGYPRAERIYEDLERIGFIAHNKIIISKDNFEEQYAKYNKD